MLSVSSYSVLITTSPEGKSDRTGGQIVSGLTDDPTDDILCYLSPAQGVSFRLAFQVWSKNWLVAGGVWSYHICLLILSGFASDQCFSLSETCCSKQR